MTATLVVCGLSIALVLIAVYTAVRMERWIDDEHQRIATGEPPHPNRTYVVLHSAPQRGKHRAR